MGSSQGPAQSAEWRCSQCRKIPWDCDQWGCPIYFNFSDLEKSAAAGCHLCRNIRARWLQYFSDRNSLPAGQYTLELSLDLGPEYFRFETNDKRYYCEDLLCTESPTWIPPSSTGPPLLPKPFSSKTADNDLKSVVRDIVAPWFDDCINGDRCHLVCKRGLKMNADAAIPTRLIDVGNAHAAKARLVLSQQDLPAIQNIDYLILSYCWGQSNRPAKTTRANLAARQRSIDETQLPRTIQDAITLTRLLGFQYLWVDAICIIQSFDGDDYQDDFRAEAPKMGAYYSNAQCLISALGASDSSEGLFIPRPAYEYELMSCALGFNKHTSKFVHLPIPQRDLADEFDSAPLLKRGWCFQERLLSPRILHWSRNGVFWQCPGLGNSTRSEFSLAVDKPSKDPRIDHHGGFQAGSPPSLFGDGPWERWMHYVRDYSLMAFSYQTDRLVAIDGLGARLAMIHNDEYFAGIFRDHLSRELLWEPGTISKARRKLGIFPSWSWVSFYCDPGSIETDDVDTPSIIVDDFKPGVECATFGAFPTTRNSFDFKEPCTRILRLNAPLLKIEPGQYRKVRDNLYEGLQIAGAEFSAYFIYDAAELEPNVQNEIYILMLLLSNAQKGILLRPKDSMYERVGYTALFHVGGPLECRDSRFWDKFRKDVNLI